jgi:hypothetical protein
MLLWFLSVVVGYSPSSQAQLETGIRQQNQLQIYDPPLLREAVGKGLYRLDELPVLREVNPFYLCGDFNGDGGSDLALWVTDRNGLRGIAIMHSTLDTLYVFGAGRTPSLGRSKEIAAEAWGLLPAGYVTDHIFGDIREIGVSEATAYTFERETIQFGHPSKATFLLYWAKGRYWVIGLSDYPN